MQRSIVSEKGKIHVEVTASPLLDHTGEIIAGIEVVRDVTGHRRADERVERLNRLYSVITGIDSVIIRAKKPETLFRNVCDTAVDRGSFHMAWIGLAGGDGLVKPVAYAGFEEGYLKDIVISVEDVPEGRGPVGTAIRTGEHFICNDIANDERMAFWRERAMSRGYRSNAGFPLSVDGKVVGAFAVYSAEPDFFDKEETGLLNSLAANISFALQSMRRE
jgi:GAF domain-containing protein